MHVAIHDSIKEPASEEFGQEVVTASVDADACSLPSASAIFSVSAIADLGDLVAAVRTAALLAQSSGASLTVTAFDESVVCINSQITERSGFPHTSLRQIRSKLRASHADRRHSSYVLEVNISSASFLKRGSISLQISALALLPNKPLARR